MWILSDRIDARAVTISHLCTARSSFGKVRSLLPSVACDHPRFHKTVEVISCTLYSALYFGGFNKLLM